LLADDWPCGWDADFPCLWPYGYASRHGWAALVQQAFSQDPFCGAVYLFRGKRGRLIKCVWHDGQGLCLFAKRLERGHFLWPMTNTGTVMLSSAQASMLLEGIDWRAPQRTWRPSAI
jgi:transposase